MKDLSGIPIHDILRCGETLLDKKVKISAWVHQHRIGGNNRLLFLFIGTSQSSEQLQVVHQGLPDEPITYKSSVEVIGTFVKSPGKDQDYEIQADSVKLIGKCDPETYPFKKSRVGYTNEFLRKHPQLRCQTERFASTMRLRNKLFWKTQKFYQSEGFIWIHTPLITSSDCEGAGETFRVIAENEPDFFRDKQSYLTVSGQLHVEAFISHCKVYTLGPCFRAEKSSTSRHLSEFWMLEPEIAFADNKDAMDLCEKYIKYIVKKCCKRDEPEFARITYTEAIDLLQKSEKTFSKPCEWGVDLGSDQENYICQEFFGKPVFITDYPAAIKSFYMFRNYHNCEQDRQTVACFDLLLPGIGEVAGGSQREHRLDVLESTMKEAGIDYQWYLDTRRFGSVPHSGFGIGMDRLLRYISDCEEIESVLDTVPFPVRYQTLSG